MAEKSAPTEKLLAEYARLAKAGIDASEQLERGQAEMPVANRFRQLLHTSDEQTMTVSLLGFDEASLPQIKQLLVTSAEPIEVVAASFQQLRDQSSDYQQFCTAGQLLVVAGDSTNSLADWQVELLASLLANFSVVWPIIEGNQNGGAGWWQHPTLKTHAQLLGPLFLPADDSTPNDPSPIVAHSTLRHSLQFENRVQHLQTACGQLVDRQRRELGATEVRKSLLEKTNESNRRRPPVSNDKQVARTRERFAEELTQLEKQIVQKSDRAVQPLGKLTNLMRESATRLQIEDLDKEESPMMLKLSVNGSHLAAVNRKVEHALRQELTADVNTIQQRVQHLTAQASLGLSDFLGDQVLSAPPLAEAPIWRTVENLMAIGKEANIELARKGFFDVLTAGRQKVFILIMFVSLMGRMGLPNLFQSGLMRSGFGLFMLTVLVSSMVNAIFTWRRERDSQSEKEMSKIKESLFNDGTKVIEQVEKGKLVFLRDYLKDVNKKFDQQLKRVAEETTSGHQAVNDPETQRRQKMLKKLDERVKLLNEVGKQVSKINTDTRTLQTEAARATQAVVRELANPAKQRDAANETTAATIVSTLKDSVATNALPVMADDMASELTTSETDTPRPTPRVSALAQRQEARRKAREAAQAAAESHIQQ